MKWTRIGLIISACLAILACRQASAQDENDHRETRPAYSPYLNLLRRGSVTNNYFGLVRPETEFRSNDSQFRYSIERLDRTTGRDAGRIRRLDGLSAAAAEPPKLPETGHSTRFLDYSRYFLSTGARNR